MTMTSRAADPRPWADPAPDRAVPFWEGLRQDVLAHISPEHRDRSRWWWTLKALDVAARSAGFHVSALYRLAHSARYRAGWPGRALAGLIFWGMRHGYACAIAPAARLHGGLILPHPQGIVVGSGVVVGPRTWIFQNVTLGGTPGKVGLPHVGADCRIFAGAVLTGPIAVGDGAVVGANVVVHRDVPARTVVRCPLPELAPLPSRMRDDDGSDDA